MIVDFGKNLPRPDNESRNGEFHADVATISPVMALQCFIPQSASKSILVVAAIICFIIVLSLQSGSELPPSNRKMGIVHIVLFEFKSDAEPDDIQDVSMIIYRQFRENKVDWLSWSGMPSNARFEG